MITQYDGDSIKDAPDGYYVAHVNHDDVSSTHVSVTKQLILVKMGNSIHEPLSSSDYRGHIYQIDGPINRVKLA